MFLDKPLLGHGPKLFRIKCKEEKYLNYNETCNNHPHNFYMQLLSETGIIGFLFLFGLFIYFIYNISKHSLYFFKTKKFLFSDYQICLLAGLLITIWPFITTGNFFTNKLMIFYSLQIGFFRKHV